MTVSRVLRVALMLVACLSTASPVWAYLYPGTGSMLVSAVIGVAAAIGLAVKMFWSRLVGFFRGKRPPGDEKRVRRAGGAAPTCGRTGRATAASESFRRTTEIALLLRDPPGLAPPPAADRVPDRAALADGVPRDVRAVRATARRALRRPAHLSHPAGRRLHVVLPERRGGRHGARRCWTCTTSNLKCSVHPVATFTCSTAWAARTWPTTRTRTITTTASSAWGLTTSPNQPARFPPRPQAQAPVPGRLSPARAPRRFRRRCAGAIGAGHSPPRADVGRALDPARLRGAADRRAAERRHPRDPASALPDGAAGAARGRRPRRPVRGRPALRPRRSDGGERLPARVRRPDL